MEAEHAKQKRIIAPPIILEKEEEPKPEKGKRKFEDIDSETEEDEEEANPPEHSGSPTPPTCGPSGSASTRCTPERPRGGASPSRSSRDGSRTIPRPCWKGSPGT